jgi:hypothetical protein
MVRRELAGRYYLAAGNATARDRPCCGATSGIGRTAETSQQSLRPGSEPRTAGAGSITRPKMTKPPVVEDRGLFVVAQSRFASGKAKT